MKLFYGPRGNGKTYSLIKLSAKTNIPIVTLDRLYVKRIAKKLGLSIPDPIFPWDLNGNETPEVYVDDMEYVFLRLTGCKPIGITLTDE